MELDGCQPVQLHRAFEDPRCWTSLSVPLEKLLSVFLLPFHTPPPPSSNPRSHTFLEWCDALSCSVVARHFQSLTPAWASTKLWSSQTYQHAMDPSAVTSRHGLGGGLGELTLRETKGLLSRNISFISARLTATVLFSVEATASTITRLNRSSNK